MKLRKELNHPRKIINIQSFNNNNNNNNNNSNNNNNNDNINKNKNDNNNNKWFKWPLVRYLSHAGHHLARNRKIDKLFGDALDFENIKWPVKISDNQKIERK